MRNTADVRYAYTSWQTAYPGHAVDLTGLEFPPVHYDDGVDAAMRLLDLGPSPHTDVVADLRDDLRDGLYAAEDLECAYAAVLYPEPDRTAEHVWVGFSVFDNREEPVTPAEALADEVTDPAKHEVVSERIKDIDLPVGPAARLIQTAVTRDVSGASCHFQPRLTVCGTARAAGARYVIRGNATSASLGDVLDKVVMAWARGVSFDVPVSPGTLVSRVSPTPLVTTFASVGRSAAAAAAVGASAAAGGGVLVGVGPETSLHPASTPGLKL